MSTETYDDQGHFRIRCEEADLPDALRPHPEYDSMTTYASRAAEYAQSLADDDTLYENESFAELAAALRILASWGQRGK